MMKPVFLIYVVAIIVAHFLVFKELKNNALNKGSGVKKSFTF